LDNLYKNKTIYIIHYPQGIESKYSVDVIQSINIDDIRINYLCATERGSSGGPILYLKTYRVIGMHIGKHGYINWNIGVVSKFPIFEFNKKYNKVLENKENKIKNDIKNINKNNATNNAKYLSIIKIKEEESNVSVNNIKKKVGESTLIDDEKNDNFNKMSKNSKKSGMGKKGLMSSIPLVKVGNVEREKRLYRPMINSKIYSIEMEEKLRNMENKDRLIFQEIDYYE